MEISDLLIRRGPVALLHVRHSLSNESLVTLFVHSVISIGQKQLITVIMQIGQVLVPYLP